MRWLVFTWIIIFCACTGSTEPKGVDAERKDVQPPAITKDSLSDSKSKETYSNARFRNVVVEKLAEGLYKVTGEGQIFEASFNWVIEDGHNELKSGYSTTDAGAPAWGKFNFTITALKTRTNSVLHLILFETSAEDGRRMHELPVLLK